ncbi:MAG: aminotransferase class IV, partial [Bacteroidota bacterium]
IKDGWVTDSYYANLAFLKEDKWFTPEYPLLHGTKRAFLIDQKKIVPSKIRVEDIPQFSQAALINALIDLEDEVWISTKDILR